MSYELKTKLNDADVEAFLEKIPDSQKRQDCKDICKLMQQVTEQPPKMWGSSIVGFGSYHYKYSSEQEADWLAIGFSPRAQNITLYIMNGFDAYDDLLQKLGKHSTGKSCLYVKRLADIDMAVLQDLVRQSYSYVQKMYAD